MVDNADGTYTYTSEDGTVTTVDVPASVINQFEEIVNGGPVTIEGEEYTTIEEYIQHIVETNESVTTLVDNADGTYTYTSEDGTITTVDVPASVINQFEEIVNGGPVTIEGEEYTTIEEYIQHIVETNETVTTLVQDNTTGVITYTDEEGEESTANVVSTDADNEITVGADGGAYYKKAINDLVSINNNHTLADGVNTVIIDTAVNPVTITIPAAAANDGRIIVLRKTNGGGQMVTLSQTIQDGAMSFTQFNTQATITIQSDGTNWHRIN
ncbi:hypothetical protein [Avrilella dinanensis]|uniref:Uncharacterized protein n=1 Tax=Avrilella dinanensis TaxID=2008672 RepID=A0A2M9R415_9FLAO|nr:hypothetical protein [Avrilella dinanensis]PJR03604.1 hypothetical protein CDL10_03030 [Avrilella dinanensis]